jgi:hypothetical protein
MRGWMRVFHSRHASRPKAAGASGEIELAQVGSSGTVSMLSLDPSRAANRLLLIQRIPIQLGEQRKTRAREEVPESLDQLWTKIPWFRTRF